MNDYKLVSELSAPKQDLKHALHVQKNCKECYDYRATTVMMCFTHPGFRCTLLVLKHFVTT